MKLESISKSCFEKYARGKETIDSRTFIKIFKDCNLIDSVLTITRLDLIFTKSKKKVIIIYLTGSNKTGF